MAGTRINPCVTVFPLASTFGMRKHAAFTGWDPDPRVRTPTVPMIALKLDFRKAFDSVSWEALDRILDRRGFGDR